MRALRKDPAPPHLGFSPRGPLQTPASEPCPRVLRQPPCAWSVSGPRHRPRLSVAQPPSAALPCAPAGSLHCSGSGNLAQKPDRPPTARLSPVV